MEEPRAVHAPGATDSTTEDSKARTAVNQPTYYAVMAGALLLVISVSLNVVLARRVQSFRQVQSIKASEQVLKLASSVPPITARRLGGLEESISYRDTNRPTVLYVFTPSCSWCARNLDNLRTLLDKEEGKYRFVGLSLSNGKLAEYVAENDLKLAVYSGLSPETLRTYKLGSTPQTIVVSPEGQVLQDWVGAYVGDQKSQVEAYFHVTLPGIRSGS